MQNPQFYDSPTGYSSGLEILQSLYEFSADLATWANRHSR